MNEQAYDDLWRKVVWLEEELKHLKADVWNRNKDEHPYLDQIKGYEGWYIFDGKTGRPLSSHLPEVRVAVGLQGKFV